MIDKHVVTHEFRGIRKGDIVRFTRECIGVGRGDTALVIDRLVLPREYPNHESEHYDLMFIVVCRGIRLQVPVDSVEKVAEADR